MNDVGGCSARDGAHLNRCVAAGSPRCHVSLVGMHNLLCPVCALHPYYRVQSVQDPWL